MTQPRVAIVSVNYNGATFLEEFALSLHQISYPNYKLYLVDNASTDSSGALLQRLFPDAEVILNQQNAGFSAANNQAIAVALADPATDYVLLLNPDTTVPPGFIEPLVQTSASAAAVSPRVILARTGRVGNHAGSYNWLRGRTVEIGEEGLAAKLERPREVDIATFACVLLPRSAIEKAGWLDERFGMYLEDTEFCLRLRRSGIPILIEPRSVVQHTQGASSGANRSAFIEYYATRNRPYIIRKHYGTARFFAFSAFFIPASMIKLAQYVQRGRWDLARARARAVLDGYRGRLGMPYQPGDVAAWSRPPRLPFLSRR